MYSALEIEDFVELHGIEERTKEEDNKLTAEVCASTKKTAWKPKKRENMITKGNRRYANLESSEGKFASVTKCHKCFLSHFPNKKFCR